MKNILFVFLIVNLGILSAQSKGPSIIDKNDNVFASFDSDRSELGRAKEIKRTGKIIDGYKHIWKEWNNSGVVEATNGKKYRVKNINFNAKNNWMELDIHPDSTYTFDRRKISSVLIGDRKFINVLFPDLERSFVVEEIAASNSFTIIKKYDIEILYGSHDPMRGTTRDKYKLLYDYYIEKSGSLEKFKVKKSSVTKLFGDNAKKIAAFAKEEKLSFKDDGELAKIIAYANTL